MIKLVFIFLMSPIFLFSQRKGDNTIVVDTSININVLKSILFQNGYTIESNDSLFVLTSSKSMKHAAVVRLMIALTDTVTYVKGQSKLSVEMSLFGVPMKEEFEQITYVKNNSLYGECWKEVDKIAKLISQRVRYLKQ